MKALFITGTDTGVGKTRIGTALLSAWRRAGRRVAGMKPIETGCTSPGADLPAGQAHPQPPAGPAHPQSPTASPAHLQPPAAGPAHLQPPAAGPAHLQPPAAGPAHLQPPAASPAHPQPPAGTHDLLRHAEDAAALARAAGRPLDPAIVCPYRYLAPASPRTAALLEREPAPDLAEIAHCFGLLAADSDVVLVEGAGGLLVPFAPGLVMADLAAHLHLPILIVARTALGTINHTLLTLEAARHRHLEVLGFVLNQTQPPTGPEEPFVADRIREFTDTRYLGTFPYVSHPRDDELDEIADRHLDLQALWNAL